MTEQECIRLPEQLKPQEQHQFKKTIKAHGQPPGLLGIYRISPWVTGIEWLVLLACFSGIILSCIFPATQVGPWLFTLSVAALCLGLLFFQSSIGQRLFYTKENQIELDPCFFCPKAKPGCRVLCCRVRNQSTGALHNLRLVYGQEQSKPFDLPDHSWITVKVMLKTE